MEALVLASVYASYDAGSATPIANWTVVTRDLH